MDSKTSILATKGDIVNIKEILAKATSEIIKWMFFFWVLQLLTTFGFLLLFLKK